MRRIEEQHNTPAQVRGYLAEALAIVEDLELEDDLRVPAFVKAVDLVASKQIMFEQVQAGAIDLNALRGHG